MTRYGPDPPEVVAFEKHLTCHEYPPFSVAAYTRDVRVFVSHGGRADSSLIKVVVYLTSKTSRGYMAGAYRALFAIQAFREANGLKRLPLFVDRPAKEPKPLTRAEVVEALSAPTWTHDERAALWLVASGLTLEEAANAVEVFGGVACGGRKARTVPLSPEAAAAQRGARPLTATGLAALRHKAWGHLPLRRLRMSAAAYALACGKTATEAARIIGRNADRKYVLKHFRTERQRDG